MLSSRAGALNRSPARLDNPLQIFTTLLAPVRSTQLNGPPVPGAKPHPSTAPDISLANVAQDPVFMGLDCLQDLNEQEAVLHRQRVGLVTGYRPVIP